MFCTKTQPVLDGLTFLKNNLTWISYKMSHFGVPEPDQCIMVGPETVLEWSKGDKYVELSVNGELQSIEVFVGDKPTTFAHHEDAVKFVKEELLKL